MEFVPLRASDHGWPPRPSRQHGLAANSGAHALCFPSNPPLVRLLNTGLYNHLGDPVSGLQLPQANPVESSPMEYRVLVQKLNQGNTTKDLKNIPLLHWYIGIFVTHVQQQNLSELNLIFYNLCM